MQHSHGGQVHDHSHTHGHSHDGGEPAVLSPAVDLSIDDSDLAPNELGRRRFFKAAGVLGAGAAAGVLAGPGTAAATTRAGEPMKVPRGGYRWLAGDHHIHTQFSPDGQYRVIDQVRHANAYGLDWMVITDHGSNQHAKIGVERVNPDIVAARRDVADTLVFQGLE